MHRYNNFNGDRRSNVGLKPNKQPACINCSHGFMFKDLNASFGARCPLLLNCGHSVCESCIRTLIHNGDTSVTCNVCSKLSTLSNITDSMDSLRAAFPVNIFLVGQIVLRSNRYKVEDNVVSFVSKNKILPNTAVNNTCDEVCCECNEMVAKNMCRQCEVAFCDPCFTKVHNTAKSLQKHEKTPLLKKIQGSNNFCIDHSGQKLDFFCKDCEVSTCAHCFICNHRNHDLISLKEKNQEVIEHLAIAHEEASKILKRLHFTKKKISTSVCSNTFNEDAIQTEKAVSAHFAYLHGLLQLKEAEMLQEIKKAQTCTQKSLQEVSKELDDTIMELEDLVEMGNTVLASGNSNSYDFQGTLNKLKDACKVPCHLVISQDPDETTPYEFVAEDLSETLLKHCKLTVPEGKKYYLRSTDELPDDYEIEEIPVSEATIKKSVPIPRKQFQPPQEKYHRPQSYAGSDISSTSTDSLAENSRLLSLSRLTEGSIEQVKICHLLSPGDFYVHRKSATRELINFSHQFGKYAAVRNKSPENVTLGSVYLVKFVADKKWYRGRVVDMLEDNKVEVYYIDYGNTERTTISNLRPLPEKFVNVPGLALHCCLCDCIPVNGEWSTEAINIMANITSNIEVTMHVFRTSPLDIYEVDISRNDNGVLSLRDALIFLGLATLSDLSHRVPALKKEYFHDQQIKPDTNFTGLVTTVISPSHFYVQRLDENGKFLENLMDDMNKTYCQQITEKHLVYTPTLGMPVAAQFSVDDKWYRGLVTALPGNRQVEVFYVDYGNTEVLMWDRLRLLHDKFLRMSCQALKCSLCDIAPKFGSEWPAVVTSWFTSYTDKKPVEVAVLAGTNSHFDVVLYERLPFMDICINALFVKNSYANSTGGNSVVVEFPRTITVAAASEHEPINIPSLLSMPPPKTVPVKSKGSAIPKKNTERTKKINQKYKPVKHLKPKPGNLYPAELQKSEQTASDTSCNLTSTTEEEPDDLFRIPITMLNVVSPGLFYVSITSQEKQIKQLGTEMAEFYSNITTHNAKWEVDSKCAVMRKSDNKWHRGVVVETVSDNQAKVLLKDIALVELVETSCMMPLDDKFLSVRDGAIKCHLSGIIAPGGQNIWPAIATEVFIEELDNYPQKYLAKMGDIVNDSLPVKLFVKSVTVGGALEPTVMDWKTMNDILVQRGLALPDRVETGTVTSTSDLLKELESRPSTSMEELIKTWLNNTQQNALKTQGDLNLSSKTQDPEIIKTPISGRSSPSVNSVKSMKLSSPPTCLPQAISDLNTISEWLPAVPFKSNKFLAYPTYIDGDCNIYIQDPSQSKDTLEVIQKALASIYKNSKPMPHDLFWFPGQLCIVQYFNDKCWYRGKVIKVNDNNTVDVQFVDYGNIENCKASELRKKIYMGHIPIQCHKCLTTGIIPITPDGKWSTQYLDFIHGTIVEKKCYVELKEPETVNDSYVLMSLKCPGDLDLLDCLMSMNYATYVIDCDEVVQDSASQKDEIIIDCLKKDVKRAATDDWYTLVMEDEKKKETTDSTIVTQYTTMQRSSKNQTSVIGLYKMCEEVSKMIPEKEENFVYERALLPDVDECLVEVTGILSALDFVVQIHDNNDNENVKQMKKEFEALSEEMQEEAEDLPPLEEPSVGKAVCACYTQDDAWYRAVIMGVLEDKQIKVQYVDFGNVEILSQDKVRPLKDEWRKLPLQGIEVRLWGVHKPRNFNSQKIAKMLVECLLNRNNPLIMKIQNRIGTPSVQLFTEANQLAYQPLLDEKLLLNTLP